MSSTKAATSLSDAASLSLDNAFTGTVNRFPSVYIGSQGVGGVTFFNGTITNETSDNGVDNPVTFGDNVRIDGRMWRGTTMGPGDTTPLIINDDEQVLGGLEQPRDKFGVPKAVARVTSTGSLTTGFDNVTDGDYTVAASRSATGTYTIDFNFTVNDRFVQVTPTGTAVSPKAASFAANGDGKMITVYIVDAIAGALADADFDIIIY